LVGTLFDGCLTLNDSWSIPVVSINNDYHLIQARLYKPEALRHSISFLFEFIQGIYLPQISKTTLEVIDQSPGSKGFGSIGTKAWSKEYIVVDRRFLFSIVGKV